MAGQEDPHKIAVHTALGLLLLLSMFDHKIKPAIAEFVSRAEADDLESELRAIEKNRRWLNSLGKTKSPHRSRLNRFLANFFRAIRKGIKTDFSISPEEEVRLYRHIRTAKGPFSGLASYHAITASNAQQQALLSLANRIDTVGVQFADAAKSGNLEEAKAVMLFAEGLDEPYWSLPEVGAPDPTLNREKVSKSHDWDELVQTSVPWSFNATLSWLALLEIADLSTGRHKNADYSIFQPLITQPKEGGERSLWMEADLQRLPIPNLIRMLQAMRDETNARLQRRKNPPERKMGGKGGRTTLSNQLHHWRKYDLLSMGNLESILNLDLMMNDAEPTHKTGQPKLTDDELCGIQANSLLPATNLFSILNLRDARLPEMKLRRKRGSEVSSPERTRVVCQTWIEPVYMRWWNYHREKLAGGAESPPRPEWLTALLTEARHLDRYRRDDPPSHPDVRPIHATPRKHRCSD